MNARTRLVVLAGIVVVAVVGAVGFVLASRNAHQDAVENAPPVASRDDLAAVLAQPHILFRSTALGAGYGFVAAVPVDEAGGSRAFTPAQCERVYARAQSALCLVADRGAQFGIAGSRLAIGVLAPISSAGYIHLAFFPELNPGGFRRTGLRLLDLLAGGVGVATVIEVLALSPASPLTSTLRGTLLSLNYAILAAALVGVPLIMTFWPLGQ